MLQRMERLEVLRCEGCGAPVPIGTGKDVHCQYCGVEFPVPDAYAQMRQAEIQRDAGRTQAHALFRTLSRPPGAIARAWGSVSTGCIWLVLWPLAFVVDALLIVKGLEIVSRNIGVTLYEVWSNTQIFTGVGAAMYVTLGVPAVFGIYGNRRTRSRQQLQAALAALPPDRAGGPARCRSCSAPLDFPDGATGVACLYCSADNLLTMPEAWVSRLRSSASHLVTTVEEVALQDRHVRSKERRSLAWQLGWLAIFIPVLAGFGFVIDRDTSTFPPPWKVAIAGDRTMIPAIRKDTAKWDTYIPPDWSSRAGLTFFAFDKSERNTTAKGTVYFTRSYLVPLRRGETLELTAGDFPDEARALGFTFRTQASAVFGDAWHQEGEDVYLYPDRTASYVAPRSAWYRVDILLVDDIPPGRQFRVGWKVAS